MATKLLLLTVIVMTVGCDKKTSTAAPGTGQIEEEIPTQNKVKILLDLSKEKKSFDKIPQNDYFNTLEDMRRNNKSKRKNLLKKLETTFKTSTNSDAESYFNDFLYLRVEAELLKFQEKLIDELEVK